MLTEVKQKCLNLVPQPEIYPLSFRPAWCNPMPNCKCKLRVRFSVSSFRSHDHIPQREQASSVFIWKKKDAQTCPGRLEPPRPPRRRLEPPRPPRSRLEPPRKPRRRLNSLIASELLS
ncbi:unnamed protein product [Prunus armeniaca]